MVGVMPLMMPAPASNSGATALNQMAAGEKAITAARAAAEKARRDAVVDLAKSWIAQTGNTAKVYGGMQSAGVLERMLGNAGVYGGSPGATPLLPGMLSGAYTSGADARRVAGENASIAATNRSGRGGGRGGKGSGDDSGKPSLFVRVPTGETDANGNPTYRNVGVDKWDDAAQALTGSGAEPVLLQPGDKYEWMADGVWRSGTVENGDVDPQAPATSTGNPGDEGYYDTSPAPSASPSSVDIGGGSGGGGSDKNLSMLQSQYPNSYRDGSGNLHIVTSDGNDQLVEEDM